MISKNGHNIYNLPTVMKLLILCTQWGLTNLSMKKFFLNQFEVDYDGIDTRIPEDASERKKFLRRLNEHQLPIVCHQFHGKGTSIL